MLMDRVRLKEAEEMADKVTKALGGAGIWGVEFFITKDATYFSEFSLGHMIQEWLLWLKHKI